MKLFQLPVTPIARATTNKLPLQVLRTISFFSLENVGFTEIIWTTDDN